MELEQDIRLILGHSHLVRIEKYDRVNFDGNDTSWFNIIYSGVPNGLDASVMQEVNDVIWRSLENTDTIPVVNFIEESEAPLEAAE